MQSIFINNKHGSLVYEKHFQRTHLSSNDTLILASTFHGLSNIAKEVSPISLTKKSQFGCLEEGGIRIIETPKFSMVCNETLTGLRLYAVTTSSDTQKAEKLLRKLYEIYADHVLKNPFYENDMPIRSSAFENEVISAATELSIPILT